MDVVGARLGGPAVKRDWASIIIMAVIFGGVVALIFGPVIFGSKP